MNAFSRDLVSSDLLVYKCLEGMFLNLVPGGFEDPARIPSAFVFIL